MPHETPSLKIALIVVVLITSLVIFGLYSSKDNQITGSTVGMGGITGAATGMERGSGFSTIM